MSISEKCVNKPVTTLLVFITAILLGIFCTFNIPVDMYPDMDLPYMIVITSYKGAGPEEVEQSVTRTMESSLSGLSGLKKLQSRSMSGMSIIILEMNFGTNLDATANEIRDKIDMVRGYLPDDVTSPITLKLDPSMMPILMLSVRGNRTPEELRTYAEDVIQPRLEQLDGVASASVSGGRERSINVDIPRDRLEAYGLSVSTVAQMIGAQNIQSSGGTITSGDLNYTIKTSGKYESLDDLKNTVISYKAGSDYSLKTIRLRDIADVYEGYKNETTKAFLDGSPCVMIMVQKQSGKNSVTSAKNVRKAIPAIRDSLPSDVEIIETMNTTDIIEQTISEVVSSVITGAILAILVLLVFLRSFKSTIIVGLSIPISVFITLMLMYFQGITINMISMAGLLLGIGMLVDNSIVVLENIYSYVQRDAKARVASILGSHEMVSSITGSTLTSVCIFLPMLLFKKQLGIMGQMFNDLAYTIIFSLCCSLIVAMCLVPVLTSKFMQLKKVQSNTKGTGFKYSVNRAYNNFFDKLDTKYSAGVAFVLHHRKAFLWGLVGALILSFAAIKFVGFIFMPPSAANSVTLELKLPQGTKIEVTEDTLMQLQDMSLRELKGIKYCTITAGGTSLLASSSETNTGSIRYTLYPPAEREAGYDNEKTAKDKLRKYFTMFPGADIKFASNANSASSGADVSIDIKSDDLTILRATAKEVEKILKEKGGEFVSEVTSDQEEGLPEATIKVDRAKLYEYGLNVYSVGAEINGAINGTTASRFTKNGDDIDVVVRLAAQDKGKLADLDSISVVSSTLGTRIPLSSFAHYEETTAPVTINRENQTRVIHVTASKVDGKSLDVINAGVKKLIDDNLPKDESVTVQLSGGFADMLEAVVNFGMIIIIAAILVFVVMASQFESLLDPGIVLLTIPLSFIGVMIIYAITGNQLNVITIMGLLVLVGTIVNNGIVLVDYTNLLRKRGMKLEEACIEAARNRLRPILMSTLTTIISLAPMAFFPGEGSQSMQPISLTVFGGMTFGSIMTLFIMPSMYYIFNARKIRKAEAKAKKIAAKEKRRQEIEAEEARKYEAMMAAKKDSDALKEAEDEPKPAAKKPRKPRAKKTAEEKSE